MFLKKLRNLRHTLALRLTVWYAGIFAVSSSLAFALVYLVIVSIVQERTDGDLEDDVEELAALMQTEGLDRVATEIRLETQGAGASQSFFRLWAADGREIMTSDLSSWSGLGLPQPILQRLEYADEPILETLSLAQREDGVRSVYSTIAPGVVLQIGESLEEDHELIASVLNGFLVTLAVVMLLGGPVGWFMARRALRSVEAITQTAAEIADGALDCRVEVRGQDDELARLAQTFNKMLDRIQALVMGIREMTDNLAHDLRSPIARIRTSAEMALTGADKEAETESLAAATTEECDRLLEIINLTLDIAEAESGAAKLKLEDIDLVDIVADACEIFQTVAEDKGITIASELPEECPIRGDLQRLQRVVANLLDNALKYSAAGGQVTIGLADESKLVKLTIEDQGIGISANELPHVFKRFYRCDQSRTVHGNGLGLSLALAFVRAHGGNITVRSIPQQGSIFTVVLRRSHYDQWLPQQSAVEHSDGKREALAPVGSTVG